jgi:hypothetical protein
VLFNPTRITSWAEILQRLGGLNAGFMQSLLTQQRHALLMERLPPLPNDRNQLGVFWKWIAMTMASAVITQRTYCAMRGCP